MSIRSTFSLMFFYNKSQLKKNGEAPVYVRITVNKKSKELSLKRSIDPTLWDSDTGRATGKTKEAKALNTYINSVVFLMKDHEMNLRENHISITPENLKNAFLGISKNDKTIIDIFKEHNEDVRKLINIDYSPETVQRYETCLKHTQEYIRIYYGLEDLDLHRIDHKFITNYEMYFKHDRKCAHNTTMKYIKNFKKIIHIALANRWMKHDPFANYKMTLKKVDRGFLSDEELKKLIKKGISIERLDQVRDCFLFSCFTGLAYSDLSRLTLEHVIKGTDGGLWIKINRKKTDNQSNIPILPIAQKIIDKYNNTAHRTVTGKLLPVLTNQKMNAYLKEIADICGIKQNLTSHLARHTFATTVTLNNNVPIESVSKMLGHSSISMTKVYARLLDKKVGQDMQGLSSIYT